MKDKKFVALASLFFLLFFVAMVITTLNQPISRFLRATNSTPSALKSFVIAFPQVAKISDGSNPETSAKIKVSVYIRDNNGTGIPNRSVKLLSADSSVTIMPGDTNTTNAKGFAEFYITSITPGKIELSAVDVESKIEVASANIPTIEFTQ